jgi:curved DNA-binding protein CbpA
MKDYYYILGINKDASLDEVKNAYRKLSKKFHPDTNDGDAFFAERFKDIQEAYECLSSESRRKSFDFRFSTQFTNTNQSASNFFPEIDLFESNKPEVNLGEEITFNWRTINADIVVLEPLGPVKPIGEATYRIKNAVVRDMRFKLVAENSNIQRRCEKEIIVRNLTYSKIYNDAYDDIIHQKNGQKETRSESIFGNNNQQKYTDNNTESSGFLSGSIKVFILFIIALSAIIVIAKGFSK